MSAEPVEVIVQFLEELRANLRVADILDIAIIATFLHFLILWLRRRGSRSMAVAVAATMLLYVVARRLDMVLTSLLFQAGLTALLLALILVFQEDIRRIFESIAAGVSPDDQPGSAASGQTVEMLSEAIAELARRKIGALLVFPGREYLGNHTRGGVEVGARISYPLIHSIFHPASPGHDGAVVVEGDRVAKLGVHLPLSANVAALGERGTRHAAALGISEVTDATVVVVSEEHGTIAVARDGELSPVDSPATLKTTLESALGDAEAPVRASPKRAWRRNPGVKASALVLAMILWLLFAYRVETVQRTFTVPVEYRNVPAGLRLVRADPAEVSVSLSGSERIFDLLNPGSIVVSVDVRSVTAGTRELEIEEQDIRRPVGLDVGRIEPSAVRLTTRETTTPDPAAAAR